MRNLRYEIGTHLLHSVRQSSEHTVTELSPHSSDTSRLTSVVTQTRSQCRSERASGSACAGGAHRSGQRRPQDESHQVPSLHTGISFTLSSSHMTHGSRDQSFPASACALTGRSRSNSGGTRPKAHKRGRARVAYGSNLADTPRLPPRTSQIHLPRLTFTYISRSLSLSCLHATSSSPRPSLP